MLGLGGMGVVDRTTQLALDRTVALKLITPEVASDEDFRERFKRGSRIAASIEHPDIVTVYEAGRLYIAMRYVDGTDLQALIRAQEGASRPAPPTSSRRSRPPWRWSARWWRVFLHFMSLLVTVPLGSLLVLVVLTSEYYRHMVRVLRRAVRALLRSADDR